MSEPANAAPSGPTASRTDLGNPDPANPDPANPDPANPHPRYPDTSSSVRTSAGLSLSAFRGLRYTAAPGRLGLLLCPPYDVIDAAARRRLIEQDPDNVVRIVLPEAVAPADSAADAPTDAGDAHDTTDRTGSQYTAAADLLSSWVDDGVLAVDREPTLYVYEMRSADTVTRGLLGAVELRDPEDGVILPHENTMAGPVADRLALMEATEANLEPIYLVYDGGGAASDLVASVAEPAATADTGPRADGPATDSPPANVATFVTAATTPDGIEHRLWAVTDSVVLEQVAADLGRRHALIADGHHRYATYRQLAERRHPRDGNGPWDRGLALLVDSSAYGPEVHPIHRVIPGLGFDDAVRGAEHDFEVSPPTELDQALDQLSDPAARPEGTFAAVVTDGVRAVIVSDPAPQAVDRARVPGEPAALSELDVWVLHRLLIERTWGITDDEQTVGYAHSAAEALRERGSGVAVLLRATPVAAVAAVAAAGARMPRKSTLFTPKPASGLVMRRFIDQPGGSGG